MRRNFSDLSLRSNLSSPMLTGSHFPSHRLNLSSLMLTGSRFPALSICRN
ncbi:hypothetical protein RchiOBHm_Chr2g0160521 [Rosa chinensis]|uniref:Uncharacterized protein n=1 Tax=Rosa chinensis TaxID=74649 RepID=A0A2P6P445_ROSCH|nr:hypothetical protein RchiOBHm_Chr7g0187171 [Rosa chinensis]PRQ52896.1 hypothetical protein RchiOBHm_Chr2g0160521 [Rosa chinensis]